MKDKRKIRSIVGSVITAICVIFCFYVALEVIVSSREGRPPRVFGLSVSYVPTESMEPTISAGEYVMFNQVSFEDVQVGDIVVYKNEQNMFIIHRVHAKYENFLVTMGDNNHGVPDSTKVTADILYGRYIGTLGFMKIFSGGISKNLVFTIVIGLFAVLAVMQVVQLAIKSKADTIKKQAEDEKKLLLEEMKKEILAEELEKLKKQKEEETKEEDAQ